MESLVSDSGVTQKQNPVFAALYGFIATSLLLAFHRLRVFDRLSQRGPISPLALAEDLGLAPDALERALQGAASCGVVQRSGNTYGLSDEVAPLLDPSSSGYCGPLLSHFRQNTVPLFGYLDTALRDGTPQWPALAQARGEDEHPFSSIFASEEQAKDFHAAMWRLSYRPSAELVRKGIVTQSGLLVDLGGGAGAFAISAANENPGLKAIVFDLPAVKPYCEAHIHRANLQDRVTFLSGDFWSDPLPAADTYALGYILSDWNDAQSIGLLRRVYEALPKGGKVIVLERLLDDDRSGPFMGLMQDLAMMLETGGMH